MKLLHFTIGHLLSSNLKSLLVSPESIISRIVYENNLNIAEISGLHPTYISDIERGKVNASISSFYMVAKALNIPFSDLVNIPSGKMDKNIEVELAEILSRFRGLDKKKQTIFLSGAKGLISGIEKT